MTTRVTSALVLVLAIAANAQAAKLVVIAVNSGRGTIANAFPPLAAGQKGFLIGVDNSTPLDISYGKNPLGFQDMTFSGPNLVQRLAPNAFASGDLGSPNVQLRSETAIGNAFDPVGGGSNFGANDSWWWDQAQTVEGPGFGQDQTLTLQSVSTGIRGGAPGGPMTYTATYNPIGSVNPGIWRMAYIVATGDVFVSGILAGGKDGQFSFYLASGLVDMSKGSHSSRLDFANAGFDIVPEPSSCVLAALTGSLGLAIAVRRNRRRVAAL